MRKIKEKYAKLYGDDFVEFIEYLETDLKEYAKLEHYNYKHSDETEENIHTYIFSRTKDYTNKDIQNIQSIINTYDEGSRTFGVISFDSIYVTIVATD